LKNFKELGINDDLIKGLNDLKITTPTSIQCDVIPLLLGENTDLVGQAQTGTGKTAAYGLPLLMKINPANNVVQGLILCPTRELGQQVAKQLFKFTKYSAKIFTEAVYGGEKIDIQISSLKRPTHIIVATPGRLIDLVKRKAIDLSHVKTVVLDEADEMLSMGFKKELEEILGYVAGAQNKWLFSATMPHDIKAIVNQYLSPKAHKIEVNRKDVVNRDIEHQFFVCNDKEKFAALFQMLKTQKQNRGIVFCKTKAATQLLEKQLIARNISCGAIHGDLLQKERDKVIRAFKNNSIQLLIATDIAARGLDIEKLAYVVHYQLPDKNEYYTHRSGRTGRAGSKGISLALVTTPELKQIRYYEKALAISFKQIR
jgi:ATP-dependent RNA helicase DeaD